MDTLIEIAVFLIFGGLGVFLSRVLTNKNVSKENQAVIVKVETKEKENATVANQIQQNLEQAQEKLQELDKEKNKDVSTQQLEDFFNTRK